MRAVPLILIAALATSFAGDKKSDHRPTITNQAGNEKVDIFAIPLLDPDDIRQALGADLPPGVIAVQLKVVPKGEDALSVSRDDFTLLSHKDGQRSGPFEPSQIAGNATIVVRQTIEGGGYGTQTQRPIWGGIPGTGGRPTMAGPASGVGSGNTPGQEKAEATVQTDDKKPVNPLVKILDAKMLPDKESIQPISGLLYFPIEGKLKIKDLELIYKGPAGKLFIEFR
jgi:hypothetical protein